MIETGLTVGTLAMLLMEGIKLLIRAITKKPTLDIPAWVYTIAIPVLSGLLVPVAALLGIPGYTIPVDWIGWAKNIVLILLSSLVAVGGYTVSIKPLKDLARIQNQRS